MFYIDKSHSRVAGLANTENFLHKHCREANGRNADVRYNESDSGTKETFCAADNGQYRKTLTQLLLSEQQNRCYSANKSSSLTSLCTFPLYMFFFTPYVVTNV